MKPEMIWPHGKQSAAMLCVMMDAEFIWLAMDEKKYDTPKHRSMGEYGPKRGVDRILSLLEEFGVKATFFVPGLFAEIYPQVLKRVSDAGHEIALHGYRHENFAKLPVEEQEKILEKGITVLERMTGENRWDSGCRKGAAQKRHSLSSVTRVFSTITPSSTTISPTVSSWMGRKRIWWRFPHDGNFLISPIWRGATAIPPAMTVWRFMTRFWTTGFGSWRLPMTADTAMYCPSRRRRLVLPGGCSCCARFWKSSPEKTSG